MAYLLWPTITSPYPVLGLELYLHRLRCWIVIWSPRIELRMSKPLIHLGSISCTARPQESRHWSDFNFVISGRLLNELSEMAI